MSMPFETLEKGTSSAIDHALAEVYRTREDFEAFWIRHGSNILPPPDVPAVDFATRMVAVVYWGTKNSGGYSIEITSVDQDENNGNEIIVNYMTESPPPNAMSTMALTQPHHVVSLEASDKEVVFVGSAKPPPPAPFPKFIITFEKGLDVDAIMAQIVDVPAVKDVKRLGSMNVAFVNFDPEKISKDEATQTLKDMEGVKSVEEDGMF